MGNIIRSPSMLDISDISKDKVFLAGGISNCPDWQEEVGNKIARETNLLVVNPRRYNWNMGSQVAESIDQIKWENFYLKQCRNILFWFPEETLCPITLFELGVALCGSSNLIVGTHTGYQRKLDVTVQSNLIRPGIKIYSSLETMTSDFIHNILEGD